MIKKVNIFLGVFLLVLFLAPASVTYADFSSIQGTALGSDGSTVWTHGGSVTVYVKEDGSSYIACSAATLSGTGTYSLDLDNTNCAGLTDIEDFSTIFIQANFNSGPGGTPPDYFGTAANPVGTSGALTHNISTQSGPTAVTMQGIQTASTQSNSTMLMLVLALAAITFGVKRRQALH